MKAITLGATTVNTSEHSSALPIFPSGHTIAAKRKASNCKQGPLEFCL